MQGDIKVVALINVVFLLMVFFIFAGAIGNKNVTIAPPSIADELTAEKGETAEISINEFGELGCRGKQTDWERLEECIGEAEKVNIRADGRVSSGKFYKLINAFKGRQILLTVRSV